MSDNSSFKILIVEDEVFIAEEIKNTLIDFGYEAGQPHYTYEAAIKAIEEKEFDLALLDINLGHPKFTGLNVAEYINQKRGKPFIFLTAFDDKETVKKAAALAPSAYLNKPVRDINLFAAIQVALANFQDKKQPKLETERVTRQPDFFFVKVGQMSVRLHWDKVVVMESTKNYVNIKSEEHSFTIPIRSSLQQVINNMLPETKLDDFIRINRATMIAKRIIRDMGQGVAHTQYGDFQVTKEAPRELTSSGKS